MSSSEGWASKTGHLGEDRGKPPGVHDPTRTHTPEGYVPLPRGKGYVRGTLGTPGYVGTRTDVFQNSDRGRGPGEGRGVWVTCGYGREHVGVDWHASVGAIGAWVRCKRAVRARGEAAVHGSGSRARGSGAASGQAEGGAPRGS